MFEGSNTHTLLAPIPEKISVIMQKSTQGSTIVPEAIGRSQAKVCICCKLLMISNGTLNFHYM